MINKLRFCEEDILGQTIQKLEFAAAAYKRNNRAASQLSQSIAELNAKLLALERLRIKGIPRRRYLPYAGAGDPPAAR